MSQYPRRGNLMGYALRTERYRLVVWMDKKIAETGTFDDSTIDAIELYDYQTDPLESANLARNPEYATVVKELEEALKTYFD